MRENQEGNNALSLSHSLEDEIRTPLAVGIPVVARARGFIRPLAVSARPVVVCLFLGRRERKVRRQETSVHRGTLYCPHEPSGAGSSGGLRQSRRTS